MSNRLHQRQETKPAPLQAMKIAEFSDSNSSTTIADTFCTCNHLSPHQQQQPSHQTANPAIDPTNSQVNAQTNQVLCDKRKQERCRLTLTNLTTCSHTKNLHRCRKTRSQRMPKSTASRNKLMPTHEPWNLHAEAAGTASSR